MQNIAKSRNKKSKSYGTNAIIEGFPLTSNFPKADSLPKIEMLSIDSGRRWTGTNERRLSKTQKDFKELFQLSV